MKKHLFESVPSWLPSVVAAILFAGQVQSEDAVFGAVNPTTGVFTPYSPQTKFNPEDGRVDEIEMRLQSNDPLSDPYDSKTVHSTLNLHQKAMIPLGRFAGGTLSLSWVCEGYYTGASGSLTVSHGYGSTGAGPVITEMLGYGLAPAEGASPRLYAYRVDANTVDYFLYFNYHPSAVGNVNKLALEYTTMQQMTVASIGANASLAAPVPVVQSIEALAGPMEINRPVVINQKLTVSGGIASSGVAGGVASSSLGVNALAPGNYATAIGKDVVANSYGSVVFGQFNKLLTGEDATASKTTWNPADPLFVVGNGTSAGTASNALVITKGGNVGIGLGTSANPPAARLEVIGNTILRGAATVTGQLSAESIIITGPPAGDIPMYTPSS